MIGPAKELVDWGAAVGGIGGAVSAFGVVAGFWQLRLLKLQSRTAFEDRLVDDYRRIAAELPLEALLGAELPIQQVEAALPAFYRYFDLCNQQAFLQRQGRISKNTWVLWRDGIETNLRRPAFALAWAMVATKAVGDFDELRALCPPQTTAPKGAA